MKQIHTLPPYFFNIYLIIVLCLDVGSYLLLSVFKAKLCISHLCHACYMSLDLICLDITSLLKGWMEQGRREDHSMQIYRKEMYGTIRNQMFKPDAGRLQEEGVGKRSVGKFVRI
jgi:hypothetical protein